jgi:hypothetical protein
LPRAVKIGERGDVFALPRGLGRVRLRGLELTPAEHLRGIVRPVPDLMEHAHRDSPVRHRASWIGFQNSFELGLCLLVPEIVQQGDTAIEAGLRRRRTGNSERYRTQAILRESHREIGTRGRRHPEE